MGKYFRTIYLCIVSFITLVMVVIGLITAMGNLTNYCYPVINTYYHNYEYQDEDLTLAQKMVIEQEYIKEINMRETVSKRANLKELFTSLAAVVCGAPLYVMHTRALKKESEEEV